MPSLSDSAPFTQRPRKSTRLIPGTVIEKPWLDTPDRATRARWIIYGAIVIGFGLAAMSTPFLETVYGREFCYRLTFKYIAAVCYFYYLTVPHVGVSATSHSRCTDADGAINFLRNYALFCRMTSPRSITRSGTAKFNLAALGTVNSSGLRALTRTREWQFSYIL